MISFLGKVLQLLILNPGLFLKYLRKFIIENVFVSYSLPQNTKNIQKNIGDIVFSFESLEWDRNIKQMYFECYQLDVVEIMKKILKPGDVFIDVGANIGYLTAIGANLVGKNGQVHSFEPAPFCFQKLKQLSEMNPEFKIVANNCAAGDKPGTALINCPLSLAGGGSLAPGFLELSGMLKEKNFEVRVIKLDDYFREKSIKKINLIKIDVEGFEFSVPKGLQGYFESTPCRPIIICEITPSAFSLLGCTPDQLLKYMEQYGYYPYNIKNHRLKIDVTKFKESSDILFKAK